MNRHTYDKGTRSLGSITTMQLLIVDERENPIKTTVVVIIRDIVRSMNINAAYSAYKSPLAQGTKSLCMYACVFICLLVNVWPPHRYHRYGVYENVFFSLNECNFVQRIYSNYSHLM